MMKKIMTALLAIAMLFTFPSAAFADGKTSATSVPASEWAWDSIEKATRINLINYGGSYNFPGEITREEFCELIYNYIELAGTADAKAAANKFTDTDNDKIAVLNAMGIIKGKSETEFAPNDCLTREEAATILFRLIDKVHSDWVATELYYEFDDEAQISDWATDSIQTICNMGIMQGVGDKKFAPQDLYTTEQAIATIVRVYDNFVNGTSNAENMSYAQIEDLQESVNNGHFPWRLDCKQVIMSFLSGKGENVENGELVTFAGDSEKYSGDYRIGDNVYTVELFKPIDKSESGIWVVKSCVKKAIIGGADAPTDIIVADAETFADKLNAQMPTDKNYMFSPLSIKMALAMTANGATGETQEEILKTTSIDNLDEYNESVRAMLDKYSESDILRLNIANSIWINSDRTTQKFSDEYTKALSDNFNAVSDTVTDKDAAERINGWVNDKTEGRIPTIITENNSDFWAMLVNAVYFKGRWQNEFYKGATKKDIFTSRDGSEKSIDFMNRTVWMSYAKVNGVTVVELPYLTREDIFDENGEYVETKRLDGVDISMYLMTAESGYNAEEILSNAELSSKYIALSVPKFNIEYSADMNDMLKSLGINKAFTQNAEFDKMFNSGNMWIDSVIHKTYIKVDEDGTEAAAVTAVGMAASALPPEPAEVKFNKPFTFVIRDNANGEILFMGEYAFAE